MKTYIKYLKDKKGACGIKTSSFYNFLLIKQEQQRNFIIMRNTYIIQFNYQNLNKHKIYYQWETQ